MYTIFHFVQTYFSKKLQWGSGKILSLVKIDADFENKGLISPTHDVLVILVTYWPKVDH